MKKRNTVNKCDKECEERRQSPLVDKALQCIESMMKRNKLEYRHVLAAMRIKHKRETAAVILSMRKDGASIRKIARAVHMDDKYVSAVIKEQTASPMEVAKANDKTSKKAFRR